MKAISLWQPWASAIALGIKTIETRSWETLYRGPLAIHAAKRWTNAERLFFENQMFGNNPKIREAFATMGITGLPSADKLLPRGAIVATCHLYGCLSTDEDPAKMEGFHKGGIDDENWGNFSPHRFAWFLKDIEPLATPIPCVGRQGFFDWQPQGK